MYAGCAHNQVQLEHLPLCMFSWASRLISLRANAFDARGLYLHCFSARFLKLSLLFVLRKGTGLNSYQGCHSTNQSVWK